MNPQWIEITVPEHKSKERLDVFLTRSLMQVSRSQVQKLIKEGYVKVDGHNAKARDSVAPLQKLEVFIPKPKPQEVIPEEIPIQIVFEDDYLLVINKEAGMVVHPAYGHTTGTLVNALLGYCNQLSEVNDPTRPGIVHRIDKDTSGLLVVAKNNFVHRKLAEQFSKKTVQRVYESIAWGKFKKSSGTIESHLARSIRDRKKIAIASVGKKAITHYQVLERFPLMALVQLKLETGRTHQIRVHLNSLGHPVFGDQTYNGRGSQLGGLNRGDMAFAMELLEMMPRQALHAKTLGFVHPETGDDLFFESVLPDDMQQVLNRLKEEKVKDFSS